MGMDLCAPDSSATLHYNWNGWSWITDLAERNGVPMGEFDGQNDGKLISPETCMLVAAALEKELPAMDKEHKEWIEGKNPLATQNHIELWRALAEGGGAEQC